MRPSFLPLAISVVLAAIVGLALYSYADQLGPLLAHFGGLALAGPFVGMAFEMKDAALIQTKALPNGAATIYSTGFDLGHSTRGDFLANCELKISAPALATGVLGDAATMKYSVQHDDDAAFGTVAVLLADVIIQTGAGGAGAAAATVTLRLPVDVKRYIRIRAINSAAGNASGSMLNEELKF